MKALFGILFILGGLALGLFVGGYLMLYGGIVQLIDGLSTDPVNSSDVALGAIRVLFFETGAFVAAIIPVLMGAALLAGRGGRFEFE